MKATKQFSTTIQQKVIPIQSRYSIKSIFRGSKPAQCHPSSPWSLLLRPTSAGSSSHNPGFARSNTIRTVLGWQVNFALDGVSTETLVVGIVAGKVAVIPEAEFAVCAGVGDSFVLAHCCCIWIGLREGWNEEVVSTRPIGDVVSIWWWWRYFFVGWKG